MKKLRFTSSILAIVTGAVAIALCLSIFFASDGSQMYTAETVRAKLGLLAIPSVCWLVCAAAVAVCEPTKEQNAVKPVYGGKGKMKIAAAALGAATLVWMLVYLGNSGNFSSRDLEQVIGRMVMNLVPAAAILLAAGYSLQKAVPANPKQRQPGSIRLVRIAIGAVALGLIVAGVANGGMRDVLVKAINICSECIGLG